MAILDMFSLVGKKGFITGAAQGIGKCLAESFAEAGADFAVVDINRELAIKTAAEIAEKTGRMIKAYQCDVTKTEDVAIFMDGYIQTELVASLTDMLPIWKDMMPEGSRLGYPEDLVGAYIYLASDASKFATGADFVVDGGYTIL